MTEPKADGATYDVFLSHNSADKPAVLDLARRLQAAGVSPFVDAWHLVPGEPWQEALEEAIDSSQTCAVFVGPAGFGTWENEEMRAALSRRAHNAEFRVIPVILPGAVLPAKGRLPAFLSRLTWVDFRPGLDDEAAFDRLVNGIRGLAPDADGEESREDVPIVCPFRGLEVFDEEHAEFFFGREALTQYLVEQLRDDRFLAVVGASGSGKSSVVRAGLVPHLRSGELPGSSDWRIAIMKPGPHPQESLASRLAALLMPGADVLAARDSILATLRENERGLHAVVQTTLGDAGVDARVVVVVDQFEEIFTLCHDDEKRSAFVDGLLYASSLVGGQVIVVLTMRADFFGKSATLPALAARLSEGDVLVPPMAEDELRRAMIMPAERAGLQFEKGLVDTILDDLGGEPGSLPLLQHTLFELFEGRRDRWLTIDHYHAIGGVRGAIAQRAEAVYTQLTPEQQAAARRILLRLTEPGEGTEETRRRAPVSELMPAGAPSDAVEAVVNQLTDARLLVTSETETGDEVVDVAHEALIRGWPRLQAWIDENPAGLRVHRRLTETSTEWAAAARDASYLFGGSRLDEALRWAAQNDDDLNEVERAFLAASEAARLKDAASRRRRVRLAIGGTAASMVVIAIALVVALVSLREAEGSRRELAGRLLASEGQRIAQNDPLLGLRIEVEGLAQVGDRPEAATLIGAIVRDQLATGRTDSLGLGVSSVWLSPDREYLIVRGDTTATLWQLADRRLVKVLPDLLCNAEFPAGAEVGIVELEYSDSCNSEASISFELRRLTDGELLVASPSKLIDDADDPAAHAVVIHPSEQEPELVSLSDGRVLASSGQIHLLAGFDRAIVRGDDGNSHVIDTITGSTIGDLGTIDDVILDEATSAGFVAIDRDGSCTLWATATGRQAATTPSCTRLTLSMDGSVAAVRTDTGLELVDMVQGRRLATMSLDVWRVEFSPDNGATTLVALGSEGPVRLVRTKDQVELAQYKGTIDSEQDLEDGAAVVSYSPDGRLVFVRVDDSSDLPFEERATLRSTADGARIDLKAPAGSEADATLSIAVFSPDPSGTYIHASFSDNSRRLFRAADLSAVDLVDGWLNVAFVPPPIGLIFAVYPYGRTELLLWDKAALVGELPGRFVDSIIERPETDPPSAIVTFSEQSADADRRPLLVESTGRVTTFDAPGSVEVSQDPLGSWFVNGGEIWSRLPVPQRLAVLARPELDAGFDSTGHRVFVGDYANGTAYLLDLDWLTSVAKVDLPSLSAGALVEFVCDGPAGTLVDQAKLDAAMEGTPSACTLAATRVPAATSP